MMNSKIKVMVVDDSAVVRQVMTTLLKNDPQIDVIATASDPLFAIDKMNLQWPDVIVLDIEMPRMDGITFLKKIMSVRPTPVVICSTLTERGAMTTMQAMAAGAVAIVTKPKIGLRQFIETDKGDIISAIKEAVSANMRSMRTLMVSTQLNQKKQSKFALESLPGSDNNSAMSVTTNKIIAIGTSTGGTQALEFILTALPRTSSGIVVVQHMPEKFTQAFAERLNKLCQIEVLEAKNGDKVITGRALIAPGGHHMRLRRSGAQYTVEIGDDAPVRRHKPSVDVLFSSVAEAAGKNAVGIIMTGMGDDGARGILKMFEAGAETWAQNEQSCVVFGMSKEAIKLGAIKQVLSLNQITDAIIDYDKQR